MQLQINQSEDELVIYITGNGLVIYVKWVM